MSEKKFLQVKGLKRTFGSGDTKTLALKNEHGRIVSDKKNEQFSN